MKNKENMLDKQIVVIHNSSEWYLGTGFVVYTWKTTAEIAENSPVTAVWWRDDASPQGYGPFDSLVSCMNHHAWLLKMSRKQSQNIPQIDGGRLVRVDFINKRRIDS